MVFAATADPDRFDEAVEYFAGLFPVTEEIREALSEYAGERAWTIAGVAQLDIVLTVHESLLRAIELGTPLDEWKKEIADTLTEAWGKADSARLETIFRTNVQTAYNRGRWVQMTEPAMLQLRPFWMYDAILDSRTSEICRPRDRTVLPADDEWWQSNYPPLHHRCRSSVRTLRRKEAERIGVSKPPKGESPGDGFGKAPSVDQRWQPKASDYPPELWAEFERKQAQR